MPRHLLVTNDFPPKVGGIQYYLWELWRRLPPDDVVVYTTPHAGAAAFDAEQPFEIRRSREPVLLPNPVLARRIREVAAAVGAEFVVLDPALPLGAIGPGLGVPYGVVLHGAEVAIPGRIPGSRDALRRVLTNAGLVIAAGGYPAAEGVRAAGRSLPTVIVPPGVDTDRFRPLDPGERAVVRARHGFGDGPLVVSVSRLVPRKGMDTLIRASTRLAGRHPGLQVAIAGAGRDRWRLQREIDRSGAPVELLGRVPGDDLPGLVGAADVFTMLCRVRWGGLEQEGFGIVFVEAAAAGVAQVAGASGGAAEAVEHGETGFVVDPGDDVEAAERALDELLADDALRDRFAAASRVRAVEEFGYDVLVDRLATALDDFAG